MPKTVLIVDDEEDLHGLIRAALAHGGYEIVDAYDAFEALERLMESKVDVALLDIMMPGMDGLQLLHILRERHPNLRVIMMTAVATPEAAVGALREQACDFLAKPFDMEQLVEAVRAAFELAPEEIKVEVLSARPEWIELRVACDPAAVEPLERIMSQLKTDLPPATREQITYAFREMLRNAIEHGGKNDPSQTVEVGYLRTPRVVLYRIKDPGKGFRVESLYHSALLNPEGDPMHHERVRAEMGLRPGGFGIMIARDLVDEMIYNERHNEVMLIKYLDGEATVAN